MKIRMSILRKNSVLLFNVVTLVMLAGFLFQPAKAQNAKLDVKSYSVYVNQEIVPHEATSKSLDNLSVKIPFIGFIFDELRITLPEFKLSAQFKHLLTYRERNIYYVFTCINAP